MPKESLHTEIRKSGTKEYGRQLSLAYQFLIKLRACAVLQLDLFFQLRKL